MEKEVGVSTPLCEIIVTNYTTVPKENIFLEIALLD